MSLPPLSLPDDLACAHAALLAEREPRLRAEAEASSAKAKLSGIEALNAHLQLLIAKLERDKHGPSRERTPRLIDQVEMQLDELVADATEDELASEGIRKSSDYAGLHAQATSAQALAGEYRARTSHRRSDRRLQPLRSERLPKLGEDVTETPDKIPRRFKVIKTAREKSPASNAVALASRRHLSMPPHVAFSAPSWP